MLAYWQTYCFLQLFFLNLLGSSVCAHCDFLLGLLNDCRVQFSICWYSPEPPGAPDQLPQQPLLIAGQMSFGIKLWLRTLSKHYIYTVLSDAQYLKNSSRAYFSASIGSIVLFHYVQHQLYVVGVTKKLLDLTWCPHQSTDLSHALEMSASLFVFYSQSVCRIWKKVHLRDLKQLQ